MQVSLSVWQSIMLGALLGAPWQLLLRIARIGQEGMQHARGCAARCSCMHALTHTSKHAAQSSAQGQASSAACSGSPCCRAPEAGRGGWARTAG